MPTGLKRTHEVIYRISSDAEQLEQLERESAKGENQMDVIIHKHTLSVPSERVRLYWPMLP